MSELTTSHTFELDGNINRSISVAKKKLKFAEKSNGRNHLSVGVCANKLAMLYKQNGLYPQAEQLYKRALGIFEKLSGTEHTAISAPLTNLGLLYCIQQKYEQAEKLFLRSLNILCDAHGLVHFDVAMGYRYLAFACYYQRKFILSARQDEMALTLFEMIFDSCHPDLEKMLASTLNSLSSVYEFIDLYAQADPDFKRSVENFERNIDEAPPEIGSYLFRYALKYKENAQYTQAEPFFKRSLAIWERTLGHNHFAVAECLEHLADLYCKTGRESAAADLESRAAAITTNHEP